MGGVVYCGVLDHGEVAGIHLTEFQKDHVLLSLQDVFSRFNPHVEPDMYQCQFIPVIGSPEEWENFSVPTCDREQRKKAHIMRKSCYCWCDKDNSAQFDMVDFH